MMSMTYIQSCHDFKLINKYDDNGNLTLHMSSDGNIKKYKYETLYKITASYFC